MVSKFVSRKALAAALALTFSYQAYAQEQEALPPTPEVVERPISVANLAERPLGSLYVNQWVQIRASGELVGNVVRLTGESYGPASSHRVFLVQNGQIVSEGRTSEDGGVAFANVSPGMYTIVARGANSIGSFSLAVLDLGAGKHLPAQFSIPVAEIADNYIDGILTSQTFAGRPGVPAVDGNADPLGRGRVLGLNDYKVTLGSEGQLEGYLSRPGLAPAKSGLQGANVVLFENGREIARTQADANGHYSFPSVKPGCYALVASGAPGFFASVGFIASAPETGLTSLSAEDGSRFVSTAVQSSGSGLSVEGGEAPPAGGSGEGDDGWVLVPDQGLPLTGGPMGGGFPAGGGGGGLGGGFGGGFGPLLGLGALGAIAAAIASDDNDDNNAPIIVTPQTVQ